MYRKLRKIVLGMSGCMCAVMLLICALPAKAANVCQHISRFYLGWDKTVEEDYYDDGGHYYTNEEQACCETCGMIIVLRSETGKEGHQIMKLIDETHGFTYEWCKECHYSRTYYDVE